MMSLEECFEKLKKMNIKSVECDRFVRLEPYGFPFSVISSPLGIIDKKKNEVFVPTRGFFKRNHESIAFKREAMESYDKMLDILEVEDNLFIHYFTDLKDI